jgi:uncharacterized membrane protein (DUF485 family)
MPRVVHTPISARTPGQVTVAFGGITDEPPPPPPAPGEPDFAAIYDSPEFTALRRRFRAFVFPMAALFLLWYLTYVLLAAYARGFMSHRLSGLVTVGLVLGLLQFVSTAAITFGYVRNARRRLDPGVAAIRAAVGADGR